MPAGDQEKNLLDQISTEIKTLGNTFHGKVEDLRKEINAGGGLKAEQLQAELDKTFGPQITALQAEQKRLVGVIAGLETRAAGGGKADGHVETKSVGRQFVDSGHFSDWKTSPGKREHIAAVQVKRFWGKTHREIKASIEMDTTNYGAGVVPLYQQGIITFPKRMPVLRQLCEVIPVSQNTNSVVMDREVAEYDHVAKLTALANIGATSLTVDNAAGFRTVSPFNQLTLDNGSATEVVTISGVNTNTNVLTVSATTIAMAAGDKVSARAYGTTAEGLLAPSSYEELEDYTVAIARLATALKINIDVLSDVNQAEAFIQDRLLARHGRNEDLNFFYGDGGTNKIKGIFSDTDVPTLTFSTGTLLDFLIGASYELAYEDYVATGIVVAPQAHKTVVQSKASDGHYIYLPSTTDGAPDRVYAIPLMWSNQLSSTQGVIGDFQMGCKILDREDASVEAGTVDDDFRRFKRTLIASNRVGFGIPLPRALRKLASI